MTNEEIRAQLSPEPSESTQLRTLLYQTLAKLEHREKYIEQLKLVMAAIEKERDEYKRFANYYHDYYL